MGDRDENAVAFEFVIGVTGHRDVIPAHSSALEASVKESLTGQVARFKSTPIRVVTGLAVGADTLVTEVALELGLAVTALLPMPRAVYIADFEDEELAVFTKLADDPRVSLVELPLVKERLPADMSDQSFRDDQYDLLKDYLVRRSNVLLALWDGETTDLRGGTSDVVMSYLCGEVNQPAPSNIPINLDLLDDCGELAIWIKMARQSSTDAAVQNSCSYLVSNSTCVAYSEIDTIPEYFFDRWAGLDAYALERFSKANREIPTYPLVDSNEPCLTVHTFAVQQEFLRADQLAIANQSLSDLMFKSFGIIAGAMGLFFLVYAKLSALRAFLVIYIALFLAGYVAYRLSAKKRWLGRHLAHRSLAETLRVQFFLLMAGAGQKFNVRAMLRLTSIDRFDGFEWLQDAARFAEPHFRSDEKEMERLETVRKSWVDNQAKYFTKKLAQMQTQHARLQVVKSFLLAGSMLGALSLIFFKKTLLHLEMAGYDGKALLVFAMGFLPLLLAVWELYQSKMATRELIWQYTNQRRYFVAASHQIIDAPDLSAKKSVVFKLAEQALAEIYLWSAHRYHREHEPPAAG